MLPAVPLSKFTRSEPRAGRRFDKPAPRSTPCGRDRVSRFEPNWCASSAHKLGSLPRLCWPLAGLSVGRRPRRRQSWTGGRPLPGQPARHHIRNSIGFPPFRDPSLGYPKGIISDHHEFVGTRKGAPTNWAGTPDAVHLDLQVRLPRGICEDSPRKPACNTLSGRCRSRTGSEFRLSPPDPWSRRSPRG